MNSGRQRLDRRLHDVAVPPRPHRGWVRAIRDALGMSTSVLARRMGVSKQAISQLETSEADRTIRLDTLDRVAAALGCRVEYVLVPHQPLESMIEERARALATSELAATATSMRLEDQAVDDPDVARRLDQRVEELKKARDLWSRDA